MKEGFLTKRGQHVQSWKKRYFMLSPTPTLALASAAGAPAPPAASATAGAGAGGSGPPATVSVSASGGSLAYFEKKPDPPALQRNGAWRLSKAPKNELALGGALVLREPDTDGQPFCFSLTSPLLDGKKMFVSCASNAQR